MTSIRIVTPLAPVGAPGGGTLVTRHLVACLESVGDVDRWAVWHMGASADGWRGAAPTTLQRLRRSGIAHAVRASVPFSAARFIRGDAMRALAAEPSSDILVLDHVAAWPYAAAARASRRVLVTHNVESELYERAALEEHNAAKRAVWRREARLMREVEAAALQGADAVVCLGEQDRRTILNRYGISASSWYPGVPGASPVRMRRAEGRTVTVVATHTWQPNRWGVEWLVKKVWPLVRKRVPAARLRLAGSGSDRLPYGGVPGVSLEGRVTEIEALYAATDVVAAPVIGGSGIKVKVLDAAARGLPVITTPDGVRGLGAPPAGIDVANTPEAFADAVVSWLRRRPALPVVANTRWYESLTGNAAKRLYHALGLDESAVSRA